MNATAQRFLDETETRGDERVEVKYDKLRVYEQSLYERLFDRWERWKWHMELLIKQATKAANWVAAVVRRDLNPAFFAVAGKFTLTEQDNLSFVTDAEFTDEQKQQLPSGLDRKQPEPPPEDEAEE